MRLFYFELKVDGKLTNTAVIVGETSWDAWIKFRESYEGTWESESEGYTMHDWKQTAVSLPMYSPAFNGHYDCPFEKVPE